MHTMHKWVNDGNSVSIFEEGNYVELMRRLLERDNLSPANIPDILKIRINALESQDSRAYQFWLGNDFQTIDGIVESPEGIKIAYDVPQLASFDGRWSKGEYDLLEISHKASEGLKGVFFPHKELEKMSLGPFTREQIEKNPIWIALARDPALLEEYAGRIFEFMGRVYNISEGMQINGIPLFQSVYGGLAYHGDPSSDHILGAWEIGDIARTKTYACGSDARADESLTGFYQGGPGGMSYTTNDARLVGKKKVDVHLKKK